MIVVDVWHWTPFVFLLLLAGLESLPQDVYEAARDRRRRRMAGIPLRHVSDAAADFMVTLAFRLIVSFKVFDEVYLLTGGGPGTATEVVSFTIYRRFFTEDRRVRLGNLHRPLFILALLIVLGVSAAQRRRNAA